MSIFRSVFGGAARGAVAAARCACRSVPSGILPHAACRTAVLVFCLAAQGWAAPGSPPPTVPMADIPGGCFQMGSPPSEKGRHEYERRHKVCVRPFRMMTHEVTNAQYRLFRPEHDSGAYQGNSLNGDEHPVVQVSWDDATAYARWLSDATGQQYRLPTEAEWEYAARAGTTTARPWGESPADACRYANTADRIADAFFADWGTAIHDCEDGHGTTAPARTYRPNTWGLYNMLGNVWEWVCSGFHADYDNGGESECGPVGPGGLRGARGGAWFNVPDRVRSAARTGKPWNTRAVGLGFRLAEEIDE